MKTRVRMITIKEKKKNQQHNKTKTKNKKKKTKRKNKDEDILTHIQSYCGLIDVQISISHVVLSVVQNKGERVTRLVEIVI